MRERRTASVRTPVFPVERRGRHESSQPQGSDLAGAGVLTLERFLPHASVFAPLLFADLGVLGLLVALREEA